MISVSKNIFWGNPVSVTCNIIKIFGTIQYVDENNDAMKVVVVECEKTIAQLGDERQKELLKLNDKKSKVTIEAEQANEDLQVNVVIY